MQKRRESNDSGMAVDDFYDMFLSSSLSLFLVSRYRNIGIGTSPYKLLSEYNVKSIFFILLHP